MLGFVLYKVQFDYQLWILFVKKMQQNYSSFLASFFNESTSHAQSVSCIE